MNANQQGQYAGFISRFVAYSVDIVVISASLFIITWVIQTTRDLFSINLISDTSAFSLILTGILVFLFVSGYYIFFWTLIGQTPGKLLLGVKIISADGGSLSFIQSTRRFIGYILSALALWMGFLWILIDDRRQGWHDKFANTFVIYSWEARLGELYQARVKEAQTSQQKTK